MFKPIPNRDKHAVLIAVLASALLITGCNKEEATGAPKADKNTAGGKEVAVVNGTPISQQVFDAYAKQRAASQPATGTPEERKATLDEVVSREIIYQDAIKQGLDKKPEVVAELENLKRNILANEAIRAHLSSNEPNEAAMQKEYESKMGKMKTQEYKAKHILLKTEQEAKDIIAQLDKGADFAALAKEKSLDTASGKDGGDLGWFDANQMVKPFSEAVASMEKGKYSKTPVQSQFGWHVILLEDTRSVEPPAFADVKDSVRGIMKNKQIQDYLEQLKAKSKVEIKDTVANAASSADKATTNNTGKEASAAPETAPSK